MVFIVDSGASRTSTFEQRDFVPGTLKLYAKPPVLTGISGTLEIKGEGAIQFQVIMDDGNVKEITTQAYWIPERKCRLFSPQSFFEDNGGDSTEDYKFMVGRGSCCSKFDKGLDEGLDNQLTLHIDPNTKLYKVKA